jgi:hypothetical protein
LGGVAAGQIGRVDIHQAAAALAVRPVRLGLRPPQLAGREPLLADLAARLAAGDGQGPQVVVLAGLDGAGKTTLAVEYAYRHEAEARVAWLFPAEDPAVLAAGFADLAAQMGARKRGDVRDPVDSVHAVLAADGRLWLLVFDNAPDQASVEALLPPAGNGRILITSRSALWPPGQVVEVPVLDLEVAARFLVNRTDDPDEQAALELARELGGLPLALEQAGAYVQASGGSLAGYLALFRQRRPELLARGSGEAGRTVATTWSLAFTELEQSAPQAVGLLRLLAFCSPEPVPVRLLLQSGLGEEFADEVAAVLVPLLGDELAAGDAVAALRRYSLVTPAGEGLVSVQRLVQAVTADQMPEELRQAWRAAAAALIDAAVPADTSLPESWHACALLLPHAQAALADDSRGVARLANYLGNRGSYAAALDLQQRVLAARQRSLGAEHPDTLLTRGDLARWTGMAGDAAGARDQYAALLPIFERVLGPEHPDTLAARASLARWTGQAGDAAGGRDQYAALLPIFERVLGPEHPKTLTTRNNLAYFTGEAGDTAAARDQYAALLHIRERVSGPEHPDTIAIRQNLARITGVAGDAAGARDQFAALLPILERVSGPEHPQTLNARNNLAYYTGEAGDAARARDQYAALLPILERVSGPEHPDTLAARDNLARWTGEAGDAAGARDQYAALLPILERVSGRFHRDTLIARGNLDRWTAEAGRGGN